MTLPPGFVYRPGLFDPAASARHLAELVSDLAWEAQQFTIYGRTMPMPRLIAMYGPVGYRYSGVAHPPLALPARLDAIRTAVEAATGLVFNSVLANLYRDGRDSVGWHRDSDYAHGGQPAVASVSFGAVRRFDCANGRDGRPPSSTSSRVRCFSWRRTGSHAGRIASRRPRGPSGRAST